MYSIQKGELDMNEIIKTITGCNSIYGVMAVVAICILVIICAFFIVKIILVSKIIITKDKNGKLEIKINSEKGD